MSCEIVHTTKTYARTNAQIETKWIEEVAEGLLKKQHYEPYFEPKQGHVRALEKATLFGLEIYANRKVNYEKYSPLLARKIFIEQALVQGQIKTSCSFFHKNMATQNMLEALENRIRRQQILYDENKVYQFYENHLPIHICSTKGLEKYYFDKDDSDLIFTEEDIAIVGPNQNIIAGFPEKIIIKDLEFPLEYHFDLSASFDGVTLLLTLDTLKYVKDEDLSRLIPGLIEDKITFLMKAMPKRIRSLFAPLPEYVQRAKKYIESEKGSLPQLLLKFLQEQTHGDIPENIWEGVVLPAYLIMHGKVIDVNGKILAFGDNLQQLYSDLKDIFPDVLSNKHPVENENFTNWDFKDLTEVQKTRKNNLDFIYYPAIVDNTNDVSIRLFDESSIAKYNHHFGLTRLYLLQMHDACRSFKKNISAHKKMITKLYAPMGDYDHFVEEILFASAENVFVLENEDVRTKEQFLQVFDKKRSQFLLMATQIFKIVFDALTQHNQIILRCLKFQEKSPEIVAIKDIEKQLAQLFSKNFIKSTPLVWLKRYPLYLKAIEQRVDKLPRQLDKDRQIRQEIEVVQKMYLSKLALKGVTYLLPIDPLISFRWKIEELRISYFAQELKTSEPVSKIRLLKILDNIG
jgi:ATP-dependent helicase HrpA